MDYIDCREIVRKLQLNSAKEWFEYHKNNKPKMTYHPERHFKNKGWINWTDWLGKDNYHLRKYDVKRMKNVMCPVLYARVNTLLKNYIKN
jgi:hypothetical protein